MGDSGVEGRQRTAAGIQVCQWVGASGLYVQVAAMPAQDWARSLPVIVETIESSGVLTDEENVRKLRAAAELVEAGTEVDPDEACSLFSVMVEELQGMPSGTEEIVTVVPTREDPKAVTGQLCRQGWYASLMIADQAGLEGTLPLEEVSELAGVVHERAQEQ